MKRMSPLKDSEDPRETADLVKNRLEVLILQHPQEPHEDRGTAPLAHEVLQNSQLRVGLSWANLGKALGRSPSEASRLKPKRWGVLYFGSGLKGEAREGKNLYFVDKKGAPIPRPPEGLEGVVVLDGTWSQAKALWWRNAWVLKLQRLILIPQGPSRYHRIRRKPRRECLSTIEALSQTLAALGEKAEVAAALDEKLNQFLQNR